MFQAIRDWADAQPTSEVRYDQAVALVISKGYTVEVCTISMNDFASSFHSCAYCETDAKACLEEYASLDVWVLDDDGNILFVE